MYQTQGKGAGMIYYIYRPDTHYKPETFKTKDEWLNAIKEFDFLGNYCDDYWSEEVENVTAGILPDGVDIYNEDYFLELPEDQYLDHHEFYEKYATHEVVMINKKSKPEFDNESDEEKWKEDLLGNHGIDWDDNWTHYCDYTFQEIDAHNAYVYAIEGLGQDKYCIKHKEKAQG